jgi:hypothetical protein
VVVPAATDPVAAVLVVVVRVAVDHPLKPLGALDSTTYVGYYWR